MSRKDKVDADDEMLPEYDFSGAVRGKYYERYREGTNVVMLDPDVAAVFRDATAVNDALRLLVSVATATATARKGTRLPAQVKPPDETSRASSRAKRSPPGRRQAATTRT